MSEAKFTKEEIRQAVKLIEYGSTNKHKYVAAKDTLCSLGKLYIGKTISEKTKVEKAAPDLLIIAQSLLMENEMRESLELKPISDTLIQLAKAAIKKATQ